MTPLIRSKILQDMTYIYDMTYSYQDQTNHSPKFQTKDNVTVGVKNNFKT